MGNLLLCETSRIIEQLQYVKKNRIEKEKGIKYESTNGETEAYPLY